MYNRIHVQSMKRRSFLAAGTAFMMSVGGCSEVVSRDKQKEYAFDVYNRWREPQSFRVRIGNNISGTAFYDETFDLDASGAVEDVPIDDVPATIFITIDSSREHEFRWPASPSELGMIARQAEIYYDPDYHQELFVLSS